MEEKITNVYLIGALGTKFGKHWKLDVKSPAEAVRAIDINTKRKLSEYLKGPAKNKYYKVAIGNKKSTIGKDEITNKSGCSDIYIIPTVKGAGDNAFGKIVAGIVLVVAAYFTGGTALAFLQVPLASAGISLILGGIVQLLTPVPNFNANDEATRQSSFFQGNASTILQGYPVSIVYGRALVSPLPISISLSYEDVYNNTDAGRIGSVEREELKGGGSQYSSASYDDYYNPELKQADI